VLKHPERLAVAALAAQRLSELVLSKRHERRLTEMGAVEHAHDHHRLIVLLHACWLLSTLIEARRPRTLAVLPAFMFVTGQMLRYWSIVTLGTRWTTTIMVLPDVELVRSGPYRFSNHPNYAAVAVEIASFPLMFRAPRTAVAFSIANAALMRLRIGEENAALHTSAT